MLATLVEPLPAGVRLGSEAVAAAAAEEGATAESRVPEAPEVDVDGLDSLELAGRRMMSAPAFGYSNISPLPANRRRSTWSAEKLPSRPWVVSPATSDLENSSCKPACAANSCRAVSRDWAPI